MPCLVELDVVPGGAISLEANYHPLRHHVFDEYTLYCCPKVRSFLSSLAQRFRMVIWTRLPRILAKPMVEFLFRNKDFNTMSILTLENCTTLEERRPW